MSSFLINAAHLSTYFDIAIIMIVVALCPLFGCYFKRAHFFLFFSFSYIYSFFFVHFLNLNTDKTRLFMWAVTFGVRFS